MLAIIILVLPVLGFAFTLALIFDFLKWFYRLLKPKPKMPRQIALTEFMYDRYPYERKWVIPEDLYKQAYPELTEEERDLQTTQELEEDEE